MLTPFRRGLWAVLLLLACPTLAQESKSPDELATWALTGMSDGVVQPWQRELHGRIIEAILFALPPPEDDDPPPPEDEGGYGAWRPVMYQDAKLPDTEGPCSKRLPFIKETKPRTSDIGIGVAALKRLFAPVVYDTLERDGRQLFEVVEHQGEAVFRTTLIAGSKGSVNMRAAGPFDGRSLERACVRYEVWLTKEALSRGGRIAGLYGGPNADGCIDVASGFSSRMLMGATYDYWDGKPRICGSIAQRDATPSCSRNGPRPCWETGGGGDSLALPDRWLTAGQWITLEHEAVLNRPGTSGGDCDGQINAWVNGVRVAARQGLCLRAPAKASYGVDSLNVVGRAGDVNGPEAWFLTRGYRVYGE